LKEFVGAAREPPLLFLPLYFGLPHLLFAEWKN